MLRERYDQIDAEDSSGQPSVWRDVYWKMRCPGPPCQHEGQYCWQDPVGKKHYKLRTHHLKALVKYVEQGGIIETHDDIPNYIRDQLYAEDSQRRSKQNKTSKYLTAGSTLPQININVLPTQSSQPLVSSSWGPEATSRTTQSDFIDIPGPLEVVVEEYANWHLLQVDTESYKENIKKARDIALDNCLDLAQICEESPDFFVKQGVKIGVARSKFLQLFLYLILLIGSHSGIRTLPVMFIQSLLLLLGTGPAWFAGAQGNENFQQPVYSDKVYEEGYIDNNNLVWVYNQRASPLGTPVAAKNLHECAGYCVGDSTVVCSWWNIENLCFLNKLDDSTLVQGDNYISIRKSDDISTAPKPDCNKAIDDPRYQCTSGKRASPLGDPLKETNAQSCAAHCLEKSNMACSWWDAEQICFLSRDPEYISVDDDAYLLIWKRGDDYCEKGQQQCLREKEELKHNLEGKCDEEKAQIEQTLNAECLESTESATKSCKKKLEAAKSIKSPGNSEVLYRLKAKNFNLCPDQNVHAWFTVTHANGCKSDWRIWCGWQRNPQLAKPTRCPSTDIEDVLASAAIQGYPVVNLWANGNCEFHKTQGNGQTYNNQRFMAIRIGEPYGC
ncbi:hypothetical protein BDV26DRAFT_287305 [Aspergillus bertholletiae]|uniref:Uncharacterized protein n=1 Tax=Aspergillus bertholletiae TaxID=1226010 RepID=A0A5N7BQ07_9EURO|nr:hypothetical protein BDV26DRAFT_287305 [Aspergillus bertholletiae]